MKILFLFPHFLSPGGAANVVLKLAKALQAKGHQVEIFCAKVSADYITENAELKFIQAHIPASNSLLYWCLFPLWQYKINRLLENYKDYIFLPQVLPSNWWAWLYKRKNKNVKIVWYCHEPSAFIHSKAWINAIPNWLMKIGAKMLNPLLKRIDISLERKNNFVVCNSQFTRAMYEKAYNRKGAAVIYPPLLIETTVPEKKKGNYIMTVGRLSKFKNIDLLIQAFRTVNKMFPQLQLVIVGDGEEKQQLIDQVHELGIGNNVLFPGIVSQPDLVALYQKAKITILCSVDEPFGLVPVESMMYSTPVIAHNSGGPKETIIHNETGFLYKDSEDLIKFIATIISMDEEQYQKIQKQCIHHVKKYDLAKTISNLEEVFSIIS